VGASPGDSSSKSNVGGEGSRLERRGLAEEEASTRPLALAACLAARAWLARRWLGRGKEKSFIFLASSFSLAVNKKVASQAAAKTRFPIQ